MSTPTRDDIQRWLEQAPPLNTGRPETPALQAYMESLRGHAEQARVQQELEKLSHGESSIDIWGALVNASRTRGPVLSIKDIKGLALRISPEDPRWLDYFEKATLSSYAPDIKWLESAHEDDQHLPWIKSWLSELATRSWQDVQDGQWEAPEWGQGFSLYPNLAGQMLLMWELNSFDLQQAAPKMGPIKATQIIMVLVAALQEASSEELQEIDRWFTGTEPTCSALGRHVSAGKRTGWRELILQAINRPFIRQGRYTVLGSSMQRAYLKRLGELLPQTTLHSHLSPAQIHGMLRSSMPALDTLKPARRHAIERLMNEPLINLAAYTHGSDLINSALDRLWAQSGAPVSHTFSRSQARQALKGKWGPGDYLVVIAGKSDGLLSDKPSQQTPEEAMQILSNWADSLMQMEHPRQRRLDLKHLSRRLKVAAEQPLLAPWKAQIMELAAIINWSADREITTMHEAHEGWVASGQKKRMDKRLAKEADKLAKPDSTE